MVTLVLADCPECNREVDAKILDCDSCYETFLETGGRPEDWTDLNCTHLVCTVCDLCLN